MFALILALLFRDQILQFGSFIKKLGAGPIEAEFEHDLEQLRSLSSSQGNVVGVPAGEEETFLTELAERHPRTAILEAWTRLERAARVAIVTGKRRSRPGRGIDGSAAGTAGAGRPDRSAAGDAVSRLRRLRREVARDLKPTKEAAQNYVELSLALQSQLDRAALNS